MKKFAIALICAGGLLIPAQVAGASSHPVHPAVTGFQLCSVSLPGNCVRDMNNAGDGSPVIESGSDIDGPAEDLARISVSNGVKFEFTGHSGECIALNPVDTSSFQLGNCSTAIGTVFTQLLRNGVPVYENNYASSHRSGGPWYLTMLGNVGSTLTIGTNGAFYQRMIDCTGGC